MEIIHILAGPLVGVIIKLPAFSDDRLIKRKLKTYFQSSNVDTALASKVEAMVSTGIALATFLGNSYLFIFSCFLAVKTWELNDIFWGVVITTVVGVMLVIQSIWTVFCRNLEYLAELGVIGKIRYDGLLRGEQVVINILTVGYFCYGLQLFRC